MKNFVRKMSRTLLGFSDFLLFEKHLEMRVRYFVTPAPVCFLSEFLVLASFPWFERVRSGVPVYECPCHVDLVMTFPWFCCEPSLVGCECFSLKLGVRSDSVYGLCSDVHVGFHFCGCAWAQWGGYICLGWRLRLLSSQPTDHLLGRCATTLIKIKRRFFSILRSAAPNIHVSLI